MCVCVQSNLTRILVIENLPSLPVHCTCVSAPGDDGRASSCRPLPGDGDSPAAGDGAHSQRAGDGSEDAGGPGERGEVRVMHKQTSICFHFQCFVFFEDRMHIHCRHLNNVGICV